MAKNKVENITENVAENTALSFDIDETNLDIPMKEVPINNNVKEVTQVKTKPIKKEQEYPMTSCLRNERIIVRRVPKLNGIWGNNPKHVLSGGMSNNAVKTFVVPKLTSGMFVNVLTDKEKSFLEEVMGLEYNSLSIYKKVDNFWDDSNPNGINRVKLYKEDTYFNLSDPEDYIRYKILLANKEFIAPSLKVLQESPKATYQFVIVAEEEENKMASVSMSTTMQCYKEFGKIEDDIDTLRVIVETIDGRPVASSTKIEFLKTKANELIQSNSKLFLNIIKDPMLSTKVLIRRSIEAGLISNRGNYLYLREDNTPLCEDGEEPTLNIAARYLNAPKHQELKFTLEAKLKE